MLNPFNSYLQSILEFRVCSVSVGSVGLRPTLAVTGKDFLSSADT